MMRVIGGSAHGTKLETLPGEDVTRPTINRVKEAMFSSVQFLLPGAQVLDLFGGSGQLGVEALSRGAAHCTFVDQSRAAIRVIQANCQAAGVLAQSEICQTEAGRFLAAAPKAHYHLVLLDPPYHHDTLAAVLPGVAAVIAPGGVVLCESELTAQLPRQVDGLTWKKQYRYGKILVTRYEKEE